MGWHSHDDQNHKQLYWNDVSGDAFRLWYGLVGEVTALRKWDGVLPRYVAMCATPGLLPRFEELLAELATIPELIQDRGSEIELLQIEQHIPPPGQRPEVMAPRKRANLDAHWQRKCERGEHNSHCSPKTCPEKLARAASRKPRGQPVAGTTAEPVPSAGGEVETGRQPTSSGTGTGRVVQSPLQTNPRSRGEGGNGTDHEPISADDDPWSDAQPSGQGVVDLTNTCPDCHASGPCDCFEMESA